MSKLDIDIMIDKLRGIQAILNGIYVMLIAIFLTLIGIWWSVS